MQKFIKKNFRQKSQYSCGLAFFVKFQAPFLSVFRGVCNALKFGRKIANPDNYTYRSIINFSIGELINYKLFAGWSINLEINMKNIVSVKGEEILKAAIAGRKACLRRNEDINVEQLAEGIKECYDYFMLDLTQEEYDAVRANTKGKWQNALLPVCFIKAHKHVVNGKNMPTVRVHMGHKPGAVFDIKVQDWNKLIALDGVQ